MKIVRTAAILNFGTIRVGGGFQKTRPGVQGMFGSWKLELKWKYFLKKKKKMQCSNTYRISHFLYRNTYRIAIILYRGNPTHVFFTFKNADTNSRLSGQGNVLEKCQITQVILVLKLNFAQKKTHVVSHNVTIHVTSFCDSKRHRTQ